MSEFFDSTRHDQVQKDEIEIVDKQKHEFKLIGRQRRVPGHTMFCINLKTGDIKKAPIEQSKTVSFKTGGPIHHERIVVESDWLYRQALNKKNFIRRLVREGILTKRAV